MASSVQRQLVAFKADAAISKGMAVKLGTDADHVAKGAANTDACIGLAQNDVTAAEEPLEVAMPGAGGFGLAGESITKGKLLVSHTDGKLVQANASGDRVIAMALEDASSGDIFAVMVLAGVATGADV